MDISLDKEARDAIGRALYEASYDVVDFTDSRTPQWNALLVKEPWIRKAEAAVEAYEKQKQEKQTGN